MKKTPVAMKIALSSINAILKRARCSAVSAMRFPDMTLYGSCRMAGENLPELRLTCFTTQSFRFHSWRK